MRTVTSGIPGMDEILDGGFTRPSTVLIAGTAGTGKTTFVMQSIFNAARNDEVCMYVTTLSEPVAMVNNFMSKFGFYDISLLAKGNIRYVPISLETLNAGIDAFMADLEDEIENIKPDRIVIDPITVIGINLDEGHRRRFFYDMFIRMKKWNALVLVTGEFTEDDLVKSELSYVSDGIMYLSNDISRDRRVRHVEILKMRGQNSQTGKHTYSISKEGITAYHRITPTSHQKYADLRVSTGVPSLDNMTGGGLPAGTNTLISGGGGTGKTLLGLQFILEGARKSEPGVIVAFEENEEQLKANARSIGQNLEQFIELNIVKVFYTSPANIDVNAHALKLKEIIEETGAKRVLVDGIYGFQSALDTPLELREHIRLLSDYFKSMGITVVFTNEQTELSGRLTIAGNGTSYVMDTVIMLRYVEIMSEMRKAISVLKMRGSDHDKEIREFEIGEEGINIKLPFSNYAGVMSGSPTTRPSEAFVEAFKKKR